MSNQILRRSPWLPSLMALVGAIVLSARPSPAQIIGSKEATGSSPAAISLGEPRVHQYQVGVEVQAKKGACRDVVALVAVPWECPEQEVKILEKDVSPEVRNVSFRNLDTGEVRQMVVRIPYLAAGASAKAVVTFEVRTRPIRAPEKTDHLEIPRRVARAQRSYLGNSPYIEARSRLVKDIANEVFGELEEDASDWQKVEALYDHVQSSINYVEGPDKSAITTIKDQEGDCQAMSAVFVALCRSSKIPARLVWVDGHCYPEFYLEESAGKGHWYPCQAAGSRAFGAMPDTKTILQKGDNFRIPERPRDQLRYASDWARGLPAPGGGKPRIIFIRQAL